MLHLHNPYPLLSPWVVRTAHAHGVPVVQTVHNYRQVCSSGLYFRDGHNCHDCRGKAFGWPAVAHKCYRGSAAQSALMATTLAVHRPTWRSVDRFIALTDRIAAHLRDYGIPDERIVIKPNGLPDPGAPDPLGDGFLYAARLSPEKGLGLLLDAWRRHPDGALGQLRIAGDGELRPLAEQAAAERADVDLPGRRWTGPGWRAARARRRRWSSPCRPGTTCCPTVILEAMAAGRPVLGTDVGGIPYLLGVDAAADGRRLGRAAGPGRARRRPADRPGRAPPRSRPPPATATCAPSIPTCVTRAADRHLHRSHSVIPTPAQVDLDRSGEGWTP